MALQPASRCGMPMLMLAFLTCSGDDLGGSSDPGDNAAAPSDNPTPILVEPSTPISATCLTSEPACDDAGPADSHFIE